MDGASQNQVRSEIWDVEGSNGIEILWRDTKPGFFTLMEELYYENEHPATAAVYGLYPFYSLTPEAWAF
ncbi:hypothetical protein CHS0354_029441 [Potamilus streckersoni]|uniref:Uncharacterized protein n=1 Tax=Potamilus streckersoni TaxID=2493646 RepID=A0AAE0STL0_9BIVA|nr:hypothetical protein CHS0354_029441 [Potamilus streckersoni]